MENKGDYAGLISIQQAIKFNGGGHVSCSLFPLPPRHPTPRPPADPQPPNPQVNHSIFWNNMCAKSDYVEPSGALGKKIEETFGGLEALQTKVRPHPPSRPSDGMILSADVSPNPPFPRPPSRAGR